MTDDLVEDSTDGHVAVATDSAADEAPDDPTGGHMSPPEAPPESMELFSTILIALAAIAIAWAGFQSAKWGGVQATNFSQAGAARTESVRFSTAAGQEAQVDITTFLTWLEQVVADIERGVIPEPTTSSEYQPTPDTLSGFTFERFRAEFRPAVDAWLATNPFEKPNAPGTPFDMDEYVLADAVESDRLRDLADDKAKDAATANQNSDNYVIATVLFATSLFFAALAGKLRRRKYQTAAVGLAALVFAGTLIYILSLPVEV